MDRSRRFPIEAQPDGLSCGPTCLQSVYRFHGDEVPLATLLREVPQLDDGGTLAVHLACHALARGYRARIYTYNLQTFDPTWFAEPRPSLAEKLRAQQAAKPGAKVGVATAAYLEFLARGGEVEMEDLTPTFLARLIEEGHPVLTGLSATWLYRTSREIGADPVDDDVRGVPQGHFVVLCGWDDATQQVRVADPFEPNPFSRELVYPVPVQRLIAAILLGILTYDANLLLIEPGGSADPARS